MLHWSAGVTLKTWHLWIAQVPVDPAITTPEEASLVFSGPQFFITLVSGLLLAFAIQLLLTNLSVAAGISYLGRSSDDDDRDHSKSDSSGGVGSTIRKIGFGVGLWTLITVSIALFVACYLAVQLSLLESAGLGAIVGLVIWAAYFSLLVWVSSTTVGSLIGSIVNSATSGFQAIVGTAAAALGAKTVNQQVVATAEAAAAAVRRELGTGIDPVSIRENIEDYIDRLRPAEFDYSSVRNEFERLLNTPEAKALAGSDRARDVNRQTFIDLISSRSDLSKREVNRLADELESVWRRSVNDQQPDRMTELLDQLRSAQPGQLRTDEIVAKLDELIEETRRSHQTTQDTAKKAPTGLQQMMPTSLAPLVGMVMGRTDLSDLSVEKILGQLKSAQSRVGEVTNQIRANTSNEPFNTVKADVENYLMHVYVWQMSPETVEMEFRNILYDPAADPGIVRHQIEQIRHSDFVNILNSRGLLTQNQIQEKADQLERIRLDVLTTVRAAEEREIAADLHQRIETYLTFTPREQLLTTQENERAFRAILETAEADYDIINTRLLPYDRSRFAQVLFQRQDLSPAEAEALAQQFQDIRDRVVADSRTRTEQAQQQVQAAQQRVENYLRNTGRDELNPEGIKRELQILFNDPQLGLSLLQNRASRFDRDTLVQLLSQRQDVTPEDANHILDQVESNWYNLTHAPQLLSGKAKEQYDQTTQTLAQYLRNTNREELDPEGIQQDIKRLFENPKEGALALRDRLSRVDRETLVQLLSQRQDLSEDQVNQTIDQVQEAIRSITRAPKRLALRTQQRALNFESSIEEYLRNTGKEELSPEGIKRDLQLLLQDPRLGASSLGDRLSRFDRNTVIALLSQRKDMTPEEAERIVSNIESVRNQMLDQIRSIQYRIQSVIDSIFARIRSYLNSLNRPELNYDDIKRDVRTLFNDPQAGFDALRDRLSHFDRGTLVALMSSREDISEADANRIIDQVESARNSVLRRAERLQQETQRYMEEVKRQAQKQAEETRKAAASAAWWLFATAFVSATTSAIAGAIAVR
ncbi:MFS transporter [Oscillatoria sp. FACHB-1407]|uniref:MFS transporter n=1 Tax=Oscillatoria sp. FACHB-1407 TaxID=2692847 RepID=UPI0016881F40|nr:MFS transporter [Oscillatoria sp. FACHB-1407]MBD2460028.1 MFS transporter [Oscillatoria sp. FACHB-1407]